MPTINLGRVSVVPKGTWSSAVTYKYLDIVYYSQKAYIALQTSLNKLPTDTSYWMLLVDGDYSGLLSAHVMSSSAHSISNITNLQSTLDTTAGSVTALGTRVTSLEGRSSWPNWTFVPDGSTANNIVGVLIHPYAASSSGVGAAVTVDTNTSTGGFVVPQAGRYRLTVQTSIVTATPGAVLLTKNGINLTDQNTMPWTTVSGCAYYGSLDVDLVVGDKVSARTYQTAMYDRRHWRFTVERIR